METRPRQGIIPSLIVKDSEAAIAFYEKVFDAKLNGKIMRAPDGTVMHAELIVNGMKLFLNDEMPQMGGHSPLHLGGISMALYLYVADVDKAHAAALAAGATSMVAPHVAFWGDRYAFIYDPFGHGWGLASPKEQLTPEEIEERARAFFKQPTVN